MYLGICLVSIGGRLAVVLRDVYTHTHMCTRTHIHVHMYARYRWHTRTHIHSYIFTYTHTYIHTYILDVGDRGHAVLLRVALDNYRRVSDVYLTCIWRVSDVYLTCIWRVSDVYLTCIYIGDRHAVVLRVALDNYREQNLPHSFRSICVLQRCQHGTFVQKKFRSIICPSFLFCTLRSTMLPTPCVCMYLSLLNWTLYKCNEVYTVYLTRTWRVSIFVEQNTIQMRRGTHCVNICNDVCLCVCVCVCVCACVCACARI
jgi:hypothetical protein